MATGGSIELEGVDQLLRQLAKYDREVVEAGLKGVEAGALDLIADAKDNLRENGSVVTGLLRASGHVTRKKDDITAGFFDTLNLNEGYAAYVEYGRRAGKFPPITYMAAWAYKKFHMRDWNEAWRAGFLIARKIAAEGTQPHPFFGPAVKKNHSKIVNAVRDAIRKAIK